MHAGEFSKNYIKTGVGCVKSKFYIKKVGHCLPFPCNSLRLRRKGAKSDDHEKRGMSNFPLRTGAKSPFDLFGGEKVESFKGKGEKKRKAKLELAGLFDSKISPFFCRIMLICCLEELQSYVGYSEQ